MIALVLALNHVHTKQQGKNRARNKSPELKATPLSNISFRLCGEIREAAEPPLSIPVGPSHLSGFAGFPARFGFRRRSATRPAASDTLRLFPPESCNAQLRLKGKMVCQPDANRNNQRSHKLKFHKTMPSTK